MKKQELDLKLYKNVVSVLKVLMNVVYKPKIEGIENLMCDTNYILAGNHKSVLDAPLLAISVEKNIRFMGKKELFENKIFKSLFYKVGGFPVDRNNVDINAIKTAMRLLKEGEILGIFPEGTRNKTNETLLPFKEGSTRIAIKTKKPIIPFGISGKYKIGGGITIKFGEAIDFNKVQVPDENEYLMECVKKLIK